jgi:acetyl-CoA acetyltransferase
MSRAPWAVPKPERDFPTGNTTMYDTTLGWRFVNPKMEKMGHADSLGMTAENLAQERYLLTPGEDKPDEMAAAYDVSREAQDRFALRSHQKAVAAMDEKRFRGGSCRSRSRRAAPRRSWRPTKGLAGTPRWRRWRSSSQPSTTKAA